jgi:hypothetical protein
VISINSIEMLRGLLDKINLEEVEIGRWIVAMSQLTSYESLRSCAVRRGVAFGFLKIMLQLKDIVDRI